jgi:hypothetical protein
MSVVVKNTLSTVLDIPGAGLMFAVDEQKTVDRITSALSAAIQAGHLEVVSQEATAVVTVEEDAQSLFDLPFPWPGPDDVSLTVGGLVQVFGTDWSVDAANNQFEWLDEEVELKAGDAMVFVGRISS